MMATNVVNGQVNGQNINVIWFTQGVYLWKTGASITWLVLSLPCALLAFASIVSLNIFHPVIWISDILNMMFAVYFWLVVMFYSILTAMVALSSSKFNSVQDVAHKNRISSLLFLLHPSRLLHMFIYVTCGSLSSWSILNILSNPFDSLTTFSDQSEDECFLNEHGVFVVVFGGWLGFYTSLQYFVQKEFHFTFPVIQQRKFFLIKAAIWPSIYKAVLLTFKALRWYYPLYFMFGNIPKRILGAFFVVELDKSSVPLDSLVGMLNVYMLWVLLCLGTLFSFVWLFGNVLYVIYNTQVDKFPIESILQQEKEQSLLIVIKSRSSPLLRYLVFLDLYQLSQFSGQRRKQIFSLTQPGGRPANWTAISRECLSMLGDFTAKLNAHIEYQTYQQHQNTGQCTHGNALINKNIGQLISPTFSNSPISTVKCTSHKPRLWTTVTDESSVKRRGVYTHHDGTVYHTPNTSQRTAESKVNGSVTSTSQYYTPNTSPKAVQVNTWQWTIRQIPHNFAVFLKERPVIAYLFNEIPGYRTEELFVDCQLHIWTVQGLCKLVVASFTEDTFGVVQMTLPEIMTTLLALLQALDRFAKFPTAGQRGIQPRPPRPQGKEGMRYTLRAGLVASIYHITNTFGHHLHGMPLSPEHQARLKGFIEHREH